ncbi:hypothetical protein O6H91_13G021700 [Diphasiastrum complanatum]|uniref:Uncharacterized protein n=1 Tax=Diphasiastrum complanatum TaxID=34168 RepID=A0ACC2BST0_DIPCM|nr:hypothetical protein O6H91_13G021700 [Diphasiastrum complanatum]
MKRAYKLQEFVAHASNVNCLKIGKKSSRVLVTGGEDHKVNMWAIGKPNAILSLSGHSSAVESVTFDAAEALVVAGAASGTIKLWDLEEAKVVRTLTGHRSNCIAVDFHPFGEFFASGSLDTNLKIWDIRRKGCIHTYKGHTRGVNCIKFSPDGRWIVSGGEDNTVKLWDLTAGKLMHDFKYHEGQVQCLDFHPHEFLLATGSADRTTKFYDLETFELIGSAGPEASGVRSMIFNPDGRTLLCAMQESLKVLSWEPLRCHDAVDASWSKIADLCVHDGKLLGCSYNQSCVGIWVVDLSRAGSFQGSNAARGNGSLSERPISNGSQAAQTVADESLKSCLARSGLPTGMGPTLKDLKLSSAKDTENTSNTQQRASTPLSSRGISSGNSILPSFVLTPRKGGAARILQGSEAKIPQSSEIHSPRHSRSESIPDAVVLERKASLTRVQQGSETHSPRPSRAESVSVAAVVRSIETLSTSNRADTALQNISRQTIGLGRASEPAVEEPNLVKGAKSFAVVRKSQDDMHSSSMRCSNEDDSSRIATSCLETAAAASTNVAVIDKTDRSHMLRSMSFGAKVDDGQTGPLKGPGKFTRPSDVQESSFFKDSYTSNGFKDAVIANQGRKSTTIERTRRDTLQPFEAPRPSVEVSHVEKEKTSSVEVPTVVYTSAQKNCFDFNAFVQKKDHGFSEEISPSEESESNILEELMRYHNILSSVMQSRLAKLQVVRRFWMKNDVKAAIEATRKMGDNSVLVDFLSIIMDRSDLFTLEICSILVPLLNGLLLTDLESHLKTALSVLTMLVKTFGPVIHSSLSSSPSFGVDLQAEQRYERCSICLKELQAAKQRLTALLRRGGEISKAAENLMASLENL